MKRQQDTGLRGKKIAVRVSVAALWVHERKRFIQMTEFFE
jgi:hypothetical protein